MKSVLAFSFNRRPTSYHKSKHLKPLDTEIVQCPGTHVNHIPVITKASAMPSPRTISLSSKTTHVDPGVITPRRGQCRACWYARQRQAAVQESGGVQGAAVISIYSNIMLLHRRNTVCTVYILCISLTKRAYNASGCSRKRRYARTLTWVIAYDTISA